MMSTAFPLRRLPVPAAEPPYDDEVGLPYPSTVSGHAGPAPSGPAAVQGTLALALGHESATPGCEPGAGPDRAPTPVLRLVEDDGGDGGDGGDEGDEATHGAGGTDHADGEEQDGADERDFGPQPTPRSALPDPREWSGRLVQAVVEVLAGQRSARQLLRWTTEEVYADLRRRTAVQVAAQTAARAAGRHPAVRAGVRSVRVCEPADGVAEASVLVRDGQRSRAVALRLEGADGRWRCTALAMV